MHIAIINSKSPYANFNGQESLDLALAAGSYGRTVSLFFVQDGVFQLIDNQQTEHIARKNFSKTFAALEFYDIKNIYVCQQSLSERGLDQQNLCIEVQSIEPAQIRELLAQHKHLVTF